MKINRDNYEAYFLDYHESQLDQVMAAEVLLFVDQNPDLAEAFHNFEPFVLLPDTHLHFVGKESLKRDASIASGLVTFNNIEEYLVAEMEGLLNEAQKKSVEEFVQSNPQFEKDRRLFNHTKVMVDENVVFENKQSLRHKAIPEGLINEMNFEEYLARELEGDLSHDEAIMLNAFMQSNLHLSEDRALYGWTTLQPDKNIIFENKQLLKRNIIATRRIVYYALSLAASIALLIGIYFTFDRNTVPQQVAQKEQPGFSKQTENSGQTIPIPADNKAATQMADNIGKPANRITGKISPEVEPQVTQEYAMNTTPKELGHTQSLSLVEFVANKPGSPITSKQFVDPQFTFIRVSQMYINRNFELYYNIKLAEDLQYAQLNETDRNPGKSILSAAKQKVNYLFAFNKTKPATEEKSNISAWTFAELGVQAFNSITSSAVELNLNKDDEGKVVSYGLDSQLFGLERDVKSAIDKK